MSESSVTVVYAAIGLGVCYFGIGRRLFQVIVWWRTPGHRGRFFVLCRNPDRRSQECGVLGFRIGLWGGEETTVTMQGGCSEQ